LSCDDQDIRQYEAQLAAIRKSTFSLIASSTKTLDLVNAVSEQIELEADALVKWKTNFATDEVRSRDFVACVSAQRSLAQSISQLKSRLRTITSQLPSADEAGSSGLTDT
jgi:hypothetical protein